MSFGVSPVNYSDSDLNSKIVVPAFKEDKLLDPVRHLKCYLKRTKKFRNFGQSQAKMELFLSFVEPHKPVTCQSESTRSFNTCNRTFVGSFQWSQFEQYFRGSKLVEGIDFYTVLSQRLE